MRDVYIAGTGMTPFNRHMDKTYAQLTAMSVTAAMSDAGCRVPDVDLAIYASVAQDSVANEMVVPGEFALRALGFSGLPVFNVENACASSTTALHIAATYIATGQADVVLVAGTEKLYLEDRARRMAIFNQPLDVEEARKYLQTYKSEFAEAPPPQNPNEPRSVLMDFYCAQALLHMKRFGTTREQLAAVAAKNHMHSVHNPLAQYRLPMTVEEVLNAKEVAWPLTVPMCAPISDGSASAVLCSKEALNRFSNAAPVKVLAWVLKSGSDRKAYDYEKHVTRKTAARAYEIAGIGPQDVSVMEVHDASAFGEVGEIEALGLCPIGEGGRFSAEGHTSIGGRIPVNPSGGLECRGHPLGATGLAQIHELTMQLRERAGARQVQGARIALAQNGGGFIGVEEAMSCVTILEKVA